MQWLVQRVQAAPHTAVCLRSVPTRHALHSPIHETRAIRTARLLTTYCTPASTPVTVKRDDKILDFVRVTLLSIITETEASAVATASRSPAVDSAPCSTSAPRLIRSVRSQGACAHTYCSRHGECRVPSVRTPRSPRSTRRRQRTGVAATCRQRRQVAPARASSSPSSQQNTSSSTAGARVSTRCHCERADIADRGSRLNACALSAPVRTTRPSLLLDESDNFSYRNFALHYDRVDKFETLSFKSKPEIKHDGQ